MGKVGKKTNRKNSNANTGEIVLSAIKKLTKNTGWTARTIVKFIKIEYALTDPNISRKVSRYLYLNLPTYFLIPTTTTSSPTAQTYAFSKSTKAQVKILLAHSCDPQSSLQLY